MGPFSVSVEVHESVMQGKSMFAIYSVRNDTTYAHWALNTKRPEDLLFPRLCLFR